MKIDEIGELHQNPDMPEWLDCDEIEIPFLQNRRYIITFQNLADDPEPEKFRRAIHNFLRLSIKDQEETNPYLFAYYREFADSVSEETFDFTIEDETSVWKYVHPTQIFVSRRRYGDRAVYVQIAAKCDWEEERGLQVVFKEGKTLKKVGGQDGNLTNSDAYGDTELEDVIWY